MSEQLKEIAEIPRDFLRDGTLFLNRCTKRSFPSLQIHFRSQQLTWTLADKREFIKISQAVGMGFIVMGVIGYVVKLSTYNSSMAVSSHSPRSNPPPFRVLLRHHHEILLLTAPSMSVHIPVNNILVGGA
jgi:protein transport protein SEC61 subunit gamma-like protein